jgi:hypothetical protein
LQRKKGKGDKEMEYSLVGTWYSARRRMQIFEEGRSK